jgi:hypothetical protein
MLARHLRVTINGVDVSRHVHALTVEAAVDSVVVTRLELYCLPEVVDGGVRLTLEGAPPVAGRLAPFRAITVTREDGNEPDDRWAPGAA